MPDLPKQATVLAADGSQIAPDRHAPVNFGLINVGSIQMLLGASEPPEISVDSRLFYEESLFTEAGVMTEARLAQLAIKIRPKMMLSAPRMPAPQPPPLKAMISITIP